MFLATLVGNLGRDAENVTSKTGRQLLKLVLAVNMGKDRPTQWVDVLMSDNPNLMPYLTKGQQILVSGRVSIECSRGYVNVDMFADQVALLGSRADRPAQPADSAPAEQPAPPAAFPGVPAPVAPPTYAAPAAEQKVPF